MQLVERNRIHMINSNVRLALHATLRQVQHVIATLVELHVDVWARPGVGLVCEWHGPFKVPVFRRVSTVGTEFLEVRIDVEALEGAHLIQQLVSDVQWIDGCAIMGGAGVENEGW